MDLWSLSTRVEGWELGQSKWDFGCFGAKLANPCHRAVKALASIAHEPPKYLNGRVRRFFVPCPHLRFFHSPLNGRNRREVPLDPPCIHREMGIRCVSPHHKQLTCATLFLNVPEPHPKPSRRLHPFPFQSSNPASLAEHAPVIQETIHRCGSYAAIRNSMLLRCSASHSSGCLRSYGGG